MGYTGPMPELAEHLRTLLSTGESPLGYLVLFLSSLIEYIFPPFPGDTVTLFGAFLAANADWNTLLVFAVVTVGSLSGSYIDYLIGKRLGKKPIEELHGRARAARQRMTPIVEQFEKRGAVYIALNRFLPGIRAFFFIAAGAARLPLGKVMLFGTLSAGAWNGLIIATGFALGKNWQRLVELFETYTTIAWLFVLGIVIAVIIVVVRK